MLGLLPYVAVLKWCSVSRDFSANAKRFGAATVMERIRAENSLAMFHIFCRRAILLIGSFIEQD